MATLAPTKKKTVRINGCVAAAQAAKFADVDVITAYPIRPYTAALAATPRSRASPAIVAGSTPQRGPTVSGSNGLTSSRTASTPSTCSTSRPGSTRSRANSSCTIPSSRNTSPPGRMKMC